MESWKWSVCSRFVLLEKTCSSGSFFFGNVDYPKEVKQSYREGAVCPCSWQLIFFKVCENLADEKNGFALQEVQDIVQKFNVPNTIVQVVFVCLFVASCYNSATDLAANQFNNFQFRWFPRFLWTSSWGVGKSRYVCSWRFNSPIWRVDKGERKGLLYLSLVGITHNWKRY